MLLGFGVENFRAFREAEEFSMRRVGVDSDPSRGGWDHGVSAVATVYGANASGKSTLVDAIEYAVGAVRDSFTRWTAGGGTSVSPFRLARADTERPSRFEFLVRASDGLDYQYWFEVNQQRVLQEGLWVFRTARRSLLFTRTGDSLQFGDTFRGPGTAMRKVLAGRPESLALSVMAQFAVENVLAVHEAIVEIDIHRAANYPVREPQVVHMLGEHEDLLGDVVEFLLHADLGITDVQLVSASSDALAQVRSELSAAGFAQDAVDEIAGQLARRPQVLHRSEDGPIPIPFDLESQGTVALLAFTPALLAALRTGGVVVIDEIDTSLHPGVVRAIVGMFANPESNPRQAQLLVTTHDTNLLASSTAGRVLERDQVWLTEKDPRTGIATLTAISEYSPRKDENLQRGYLTGRYGGVPDLAFGDFFLGEMADSGATARP